MPDFLTAVEAKVVEQLGSQRIGYLLGAGSSYLGGAGYPLATELWGQIKDLISDGRKRADIQDKLDGGAAGLEQALDLLDDGGAADTPYRHIVTSAIAELFATRTPPLDWHTVFLKRLGARPDPNLMVFSLNYDPLLERAADAARIRIVDGFVGTEHAFFEPAVFEERIGRIRGTYRGRQFEATARPLRILKLHGSVGWYECPTNGVRRCGYDLELPAGTRRLMVPPQRRKATETMLPPYASLWSAFRGSLGQDARPLNRLVCIGYGLSDEHVNAVVEAALARPNFTLLVFTKSLSDLAWNRWSKRANVLLVTETRCSVSGQTGPGHVDMCQFERICKEV